MTATTPLPIDVEQPAFAIVARRITREDIEAITARRAGLAPVVPDPLDIGLWSPMRYQLALVLDAAVSLFPGDTDMITRELPDTPGFNPDDLTPGDICMVRYGLNSQTRAQFVRRTRNPDWFIVLRWNPYERRYARDPRRLHRRSFIGRANTGEV